MVEINAHAVAGLFIVLCGLVLYLYWRHKKKNKRKKGDVLTIVFMGVEIGTIGLLLIQMIFQMVSSSFFPDKIPNDYLNYIGILILIFIGNSLWQYDEMFGSEEDIN